jgi:hypothetical protein
VNFDAWRSWFSTIEKMIVEIFHSNYPSTWQ